MPTYAYRCTECSNELEVKQSFTDNTLTVCTECGGALRKLFSSVGVVFKGSGFYRNDSRPSSTTSTGAAAKESSGSSSTDSSSSSSTSSTSSSSSSSSTTTTAPAKAKAAAAAG